MKLIIRIREMSKLQKLIHLANTVDDKSLARVIDLLRDELQNSDWASFANGLRKPIDSVYQALVGDKVNIRDKTLYAVFEVINHEITKKEIQADAKRMIAYKQGQLTEALSEISELKLILRKQ